MKKLVSDAEVLARYNEIRWKGIARKYKMTLKRAKQEYPAETKLPMGARETVMALWKY